MFCFALLCVVSFLFDNMTSQKVWATSTTTCNHVWKIMTMTLTKRSITVTRATKWGITCTYAMDVWRLQPVVDEGLTPFPRWPTNRCKISGGWDWEMSLSTKCNDRFTLAWPNWTCMFLKTPPSAANQKLVIRHFCDVYRFHMGHRADPIIIISSGGLIVGFLTILFLGQSRLPTVVMFGTWGPEFTGVTMSSCTLRKEGKNCPEHPWLQVLPMFHGHQKLERKEPWWLRIKGESRSLFFDQ